MVKNKIPYNEKEKQSNVKDNIDWKRRVKNMKNKLMKYHKIGYDGMLKHSKIIPPEWDTGRKNMLENNKVYYVQEKIDGMQFRASFNTDTNEIVYGSHNVIFDETMKTSEKWALAVKSVNNAFSLIKNKISFNEMTLFMEYLPKIRTNKIKYERIPYNNLVLFDVVFTHGDKIVWVGPKEIVQYALEMELEPIKTFKIYTDEPTDEKLENLMETAVSALGNIKPEGFVVKSAYYSYYPDVDRTEPYAYKWVRDSFKEYKPNDWKNKLPENENDAIMKLLNKEAVIDKAIMRAEESGELKGNMTDMKFIIKSLMKEFEDEYDNYLKDKIYNLYRWKIVKSITDDLAYIYKRRVMAQQKEEE